MDSTPAQGVYVDVLIAVNFIIDFLLLSVSSRIAGRKSPDTAGGKARLLLAALTGSLFSMTIFLPDLPPAGELVSKLLASGLMVLTAHRFQGIRQLLKEWGALFVITALFGGIMLAICVCLAPNFMLCSNGVVYFHMSPVLLIINITAAYVVVCLADRLFQLSRLEEGTYPITLVVLGKEKQLTALVDTGNSLTEPFSGLPVIVCGQEDLGELVPQELSSFLLSGGIVSIPDEWKRQVRMVPYSAVGSAGVLPALKGDRLLIQTEEKQVIAEAFYVAVSREPVGNGSYQALLSRNLLKAGERQTGPEKQIRV